MSSVLHHQRCQFTIPDYWDLTPLSFLAEESIISLAATSKEVCCYGIHLKNSLLMRLIGSDLIFGSGIAYFDSSSFASNAAGAVAAHLGVASNANDKWIFNNVELFSTTPSQLISSFASPSRPANTAGQNYAGRAGDAFARISFLFSGFSTNIAEAAWQSTGQFSEFQNDGARGAFSVSRAVSAELLSGEQTRPYALQLLLGNGLTALAWIDQSLTPQCGGIYAQCAGSNFTGKTCCEAPFTCVARDSSMPLHHHYLFIFY